MQNNDKRRTDRAINIYILTVKCSSEQRFDTTQKKFLQYDDALAEAYEALRFNIIIIIIIIIIKPLTICAGYSAQVPTDGTSSSCNA